MLGSSFAESLVASDHFWQGFLPFGSLFILVTKVMSAKHNLFPAELFEHLKVGWTSEKEGRILKGPEYSWS